MESKKLKVLMIGNSFSLSVGRYLPEVVQSSEGFEIDLTCAYIGGCSLQTHWNNLVESGENDDAKQYAAYRWTTSPDGVKSENYPENINTLIKMADWDVITIQQASHESWNYDFYQPYASDLIAYIKKWSPESKMMIQQTWAYRADDTRLQENGSWGFDQAGMHERLTRAYRQLAAATSFPVIPVGIAVKLYRDNEPAPFVPPTREELQRYRWPDLPSQCGDIVGTYYYGKDENGNHKIIADTIHLNRRGDYLQACVWFVSLFGAEVPDNSYIPDEVDKNDAILFRKYAREVCEKGLFL